MPPPFTDGRVHVMAARCPTCIFRPGNLCHLTPGRVDQMVTDALAADAAITCHSTLYVGDTVQEGVCRGFYDRHGDATLPLRLARHLDLLTFIEPPTKGTPE